MAGLKQLIQEIHRRSLWQVLLIYVGAAWFGYEIIDAITERLALPEWLPVLAIILFIIGLPIVLATAVVQEGGPSLRRVDPTLIPDADRVIRSQAAGARRLLTWRNAISGGVLALALWGIVATGWIVLYGGATSETSDYSKSVAVLPLTNMSANADDQYFTDGIHEAIIEHLAKIADLKVISRTSVMEYRDTRKNVRQIAAELGVAALLEGGVQRAGNLVKITAQLIEAESDQHLWAESYERELTAQNVFSIQSDVARRIAEALEASLTPAEQEQLEQQLTDNLEAYDFYLRGNEFMGRSYALEDFRLALQMYERAVELDPDFAVAYGKLSQLHSRFYWFDIDVSPERLEMARVAANRALELAPDLAETRLSLGYYHYWGHLDYEAALEELTLAREISPNHPEVVFAIGAVYRRQGRWEEAAGAMVKAFELDPRSSERAINTAQTLRLMRNYAEAERYYDLVLKLAPSRTRAHSLKAFLYLSWKGDTEMAREVLESGARYLDWRQEPLFVMTWTLTDLADGRYAEALARLDSVPADMLDAVYLLRPVPALRAQSYGLMGRPDLALAAYESARALIQQELNAGSYHSRREGEYRAALAIAYAGLERSEDAIREARAAADLSPVSEDAWRGAVTLEQLARVYTMVDQADKAIDRLELLLSRPGELSVPLLRIDPGWDPLRSHPRFQALLEKYALSPDQ